VPVNAEAGAVKVIVPELPVPGDEICVVRLPGTPLRLRVTGLVSPATRWTVTVIGGDEPKTGAVVALDDSEIVIGLYAAGLMIKDGPPVPQPPSSSEPPKPKKPSKTVFRHILDVSF
jgi:hypothetical protein